ncbi:MAG: MATE family efflux transporter [Flavobacteriales bacterium]|nr:MATE family efflux transporter [Flavobacteriales bacterium]MBK6943458.1 MATE family efflux transporter [Flavobacteriales bacterium]MBK7240655.1 MATE family efflux transporter [Flavobacteriales bacterium]MBK7297344.1 MATE family efflux transporter [Flavobacteriales bacterium]MBK9536005.1 MATE family efflux transporter [Flavobacteriales bacterium]
MARITRRDIDRLAFPAIIAGIAEPVISLVDTAFVGRLGTADLAAVGIASSFFLLVVWTLAQTRSAVLAVVARYYGEDKLDEVAGLVPIAVWMNFLLGFLFFALTNAFAEPIFRMYNAQGDVLSKAVEYYHVRSYGHPIVLATFAITGAFRGIQNLKWNMWISIAGALVNGLLNPIMIFGWGPVEGMGMVGSAWSSLIAQGVMFVMAVYILHTRTPFSLFPKGIHHPELLNLWKLSGNLFARTTALNVCYYLGNRYATGYGEAYIGAHSIAMQIWLFSAFFIDGYAAAGSVLVGRLNGEKNWRDLYRVSWQVVRMSVTIGVILSVIYLAGYNVIGGLFTKDGAVLDLFHAIFWMIVITQPINAIAFAFDGVYKGLGDGKILRNVLIASTLFFFIPVAVGGNALDGKLYAIWSAFLVWMLARGVLLAVHFEKNFGKASLKIRVRT